MTNQEAGKRRRHPRYDVEDVRGSLRLSMDATILNLSVDGMALETHSWLGVGESYSFKLRHGEESIQLTGNVIWCTLVRTAHNEKGETLPVYRAGVQFEEILSEKAQQVRDFVEQNAIVHLDSTRVFGRFRVAREGEVDVDFEKGFAVRRLSLSGMLIEAPVVPELESRFEVEVGEGERSLRATVRVAHVEEIGGEEEGPRAEVGVEFLSLTAEDREIVQLLIAEEGTDED